jgi:hypothetical protein
MKNLLGQLTRCQDKRYICIHIHIHIYEYIYMNSILYDSSKEMEIEIINSTLA